MRKLFATFTILLSFNALAHHNNGQSECEGQFRFQLNGSQYGTLSISMTSPEDFRGQVSGFAPDSTVYGRCAGGQITIYRPINNGSGMQVYNGNYERSQAGPANGNGSLVQPGSGSIPFTISQIERFNRWGCAGRFQINSSHFSGTILEIPYTDPNGSFNGFAYGQSVSGYCAPDGRLTFYRLINQGTKYQTTQTFEAFLRSSGRGGSSTMSGTPDFGGQWSAEKF